MSEGAVKRLYVCGGYMDVSEMVVFMIVTIYVWTKYP